VVIPAGHDGGHTQCVQQAAPNPIVFYNLGILYEAVQNWPAASRNFELFLNSGKASGIYQESARAEIAKLKTLQGPQNTGTQASDSSDRDLDVAAQMLKLGLPAEAELIAKRAAVERGTYRAYTYAAIAEYQQRKLDFALKDISKALDTAPASERSSLSSLKSEIQTAVNIVQLCSAARTALRTDPKSSAQLYKAAWDLKPARTDIGFAAVLAYFGSSDPRPADDILQRLAADSDPSVAARAQHMRSQLQDIVQRRLQKRNEVNAQFLALLKNNKKDWSDLGSKDLQRLVSSLEQLVQLDPENEPIRHRLAFVLSRQQRWPEAETQYKYILRVNPQAQVNFWLARVLFKERKYEESEQALLQSIPNPGTESAELRDYLAEDLRDKLKTKR
jgi:tetratricopeptide (TPR) repeat protein